jgi:hypothetical protein
MRRTGGPEVRAEHEGVLRWIYRSRLTPPWVRRAYHREHWRLLDLRENLRGRRLLAAGRAPEGFRDKLRYKMATDRRPILTTFADRVAVRPYVEAALGPGFLPELYLITDDPRDLRPDGLPREFVLKPAHGSGAGILVADIAPPGARLPRLPARWLRSLVRSEQLDWDVLRAFAALWLERRYGPGEWAYRNVPRRLVAEELLLAGGEIPADHRIFVFNGRPRLVQVDRGRFDFHTQSFYTPEWERVELRAEAWPACELPRPARLEEMLAVAETLSRETDFLRVDLYPLEKRFVVGELTSYPWGGIVAFQPPEVDRRVGAWWGLPERYTQEEIERLARAAACEP